MTSAAAVRKSLRTYYAPGRAALLDAFYARFIGPGALAFDIGAHVGDRSASFLRLGADVVAVEPQPRLRRALRLLVRGNPRVTLLGALVGAEAGEATLRVNTANPTVASASDAFIAAVKKALKGKHLSAAEIARLKAEHADTLEPARRAAADILQLERRLSDLVNDAYGLTPEDVKLMWETAPPRMPLDPAQELARLTLRQAAE